MYWSVCKNVKSDVTFSLNMLFVLKNIILIRYVNYVNM